MQLRNKCIAACAIMFSSIVTLPAYAQQKSAIDNAVRTIERNDRDKTPSSVSFTENAGYKASDAQTVFAKYLQLNAATDEMRFRKADAATAEINVDRFDQYFKGIKVEHGNYIIASKNGVMSYMSGNFYQTNASIANTPVLTEAAAFAKATQHIGAKKYYWDDANGRKMLEMETGIISATGIPKGELVYVEDYFSGTEPDGILHLAYRFDIYAAEPLSRSNVYVDAATGRVLFTDAIMKHVHANGASLYSGQVGFMTGKLNDTTYALHDSTRGSGIFTYSLNGSTNYNNRVNKTDNDTVWASNVAIDAHWGATEVYDYWKNTHNRLSWNGTNGILVSYVDFDVNYNNASWSGNVMRYGNGTGRASGGFDPLVALDICGHEMGHGVCQATAGLIYSRESGGMNEGFSDIWGATIEHFADPHETDATAKRYWDIGEEISGTPLRSMANPKLYGDPDCYKGTYWKYAASNCTPSNTNDQCGVHSNSGVLNKWYYLLTVGGSGTNDVGNGYAVLGLGFDTAAIIAYGTELSLTSSSNYAAARTASINFATTKYGACSRAVEMVTRAWYAVNVGANYISCTAQISFPAPNINVSENAEVNSCSATRTVNIPVQLNGPAPTGGNAVVTVNITGGTAVSGVDYTMASNTLTFPAGSTAAQNIVLTIIDNGNTLDTTRYIDFELTLAANGSNATFASVLTTGRVTIVNDDFAPVVGNNSVTSIVGVAGPTVTTTSPFQSRYNQGRVQYIYTAAELMAGGLRKGSDITRILFNVTDKNSTIPYTGYTVRLGLTNISEYTSSFVTAGLVQVYQNDLTTNLGLNTLLLTTPFTWDGESNLVMEMCFNNTTRTTDNDAVQGAYTGAARVTWSSNNLTGGGACNNAFTASNLSSDGRPITRFVHTIPPAAVEVNMNNMREWKMSANQRAYFYSVADTQVIAGVWSLTSDLNCVKASLSAEGVGFVPSTFSSVRRSVKELTITAENVDTISNHALFYMTDVELDGQSLANLQLVKTTATTDAGINSSNLQVVPLPLRTTGTNYKSFRGLFTGVGRYFLVDGTPNVGVNSLIGDNRIHVVNNPFRNDIHVAYELQKAETATVKLYDIAGKVIYSNEQALHAGKSQFDVPTGTLNLAPGYYVLNIVTASGTYNQKMLKQ